MDDTILKLMDSAEPKDRKRAIKLLIEDGTQEALKYLAVMYKTDSDPEIRDLAVKAGRYVKKQQVAGQWEGGGMKDVPKKELPPEKQPGYVPVSAAKQEQSKGYMEQAMDMSIARNQKKAVELIQKAFTLNPNLRYEAYYMNMATDITGLSKEQFLARMFGEGEEDEAEADMPAAPVDDKAKRKRKNEEARDDGEVTWETALTDLAIFYVVIAGIIIVGMLLALQSFSGLMRSYINEMNELSEFYEYGELSQETMQQMMTARQVEAVMSGIVGAGIIGSIIYGLIYALFALVGLLILYAFVHLAAMMILGGEGTFRGLIHHANNCNLFFYGFGMILGFGLAGLMLSSLFSLTALDPTMTETEMMATINSPAATLLPLAWLIFFGFWIFWLVWFSRSIGRAYAFSAWRGCGSILFAYIIMTALSCACSFAFSSTLANLMMNVSTGGSF